MKLTIQEIEDIGLINQKDYNGNPLNIWQMYIGEYDVYFHYDSRDGILSCRCSEGGDWSMVYDNLTLEKFNKLKDILA